LSKVVSSENTAGKVIDFVPRTLERHLSPQAEEYISQQQLKKSSFKLSHLIAGQVGIAQREKQVLDEEIQKVALEQLKAIQQEAYKEAYDLGLEEGRKTAYEENKGQIEEDLGKLDTLITNISNLKTLLLEQNEAHFLKSIFHIASRLAGFEIEKKDDRILGVLKQVLQSAQTDENVLVRLSEDDFKFIEKFKEVRKKEFDFIKKVKFEASSDIQNGGCVVETNYGTIDANVEERVQKAWSALIENLPIAKDTVAHES